MITAKLDLSKLFHKLKVAPGIIHAELAKKFESEARLLVSSSGNVPGLVQVTPPSQGKANLAAKKRGEAKIASDIRKAYGTASDLWRLIHARAGRPAADNFWAYLKLGRWQQANEIALRLTGHVLDVFDGGTEHHRRRSPRTGRVIGGAQPGNKRVFLSPTQDKVLAAYIKQQQGRVGLLASSLPAAANAKLGKISGVPAWIARHRGRLGVCREQRGKSSYFVIVGLSVRGETEMLRRFQYVLRYRYAALQRQLPYLKRAALKKARLQLA